MPKFAHIQGLGNCIVTPHCAGYTSAAVRISARTRRVNLMSGVSSLPATHLPQADAQIHRVSTMTAPAYVSLCPPSHPPSLPASSWRRTAHRALLLGWNYFAFILGLLLSLPHFYRSLRCYRRNGLRDIRYFSLFWCPWIIAESHFSQIRAKASQHSRHLSTYFFLPSCF